MNSTVIIIGVLVLIVGGGSIGYLISIYNSLVQVKNNVEKTWKNIDILLQQRHDELPKLIDTCKAYIQHERETLESVVKLRAGYKKASKIDDKINIENQINDLMGKINIVMEEYPEIKASQNFMQIQGRVTDLESSIADRREFFNDSVNIYNIQIERFPEVLLAKPLGYEKHKYLEIPEEKKADVKMDFS